jgi:hypothetical protein
MEFFSYNIIFDIDISNYETDNTKIRHENMSIYEILPALDLTQSVHAKISIGMHRVVKFKISRIPLIGLETRLE